MCSRAVPKNERCLCDGWAWWGSTEFKPANSSSRTDRALRIHRHRPPAQEAHSDRDAAARRRVDRLAKAATDQMQAALAFLSMIDSEAFEIASGAHETYDPGHPS
jgi:hypothetical protein